MATESNRSIAFFSTLIQNICIQFVGHWVKIFEITNGSTNLYIPIILVVKDIINWKKKFKL